VIVKIGKGQSVDRIIAAIRDVCERNPLGAMVDVSPVEPEYTREEERGFHWLLQQWLVMDRSITWPHETLKTKVLIAHFGAVRLVGPGGQEELIPARRTTSVWDHDKKKYRRKKLSVEQYAELIDFVYRMAAQDGTVLPVMQKEEAA